LHVVFDHHLADLGELHLNLAVKNITEAIAPGNDPGVKHDPISQLHSRIKNDVGVKKAFLPHNAAISDDNAGVEHTSSADLGGPHCHIGANVDLMFYDGDG